MSVKTEKTIRLVGDGVQKEALASGTISPGMLIASTSAAVDTVIAHNVSGGAAIPKFAIEDSLQGNGITDDYSSGARVLYIVARRGDEVYARIANGQNIAKGTKLMSNGAGALTTYVAQKKGDAGDSSGTDEDIVLNKIIGEAKEACDMSGSSGVDPVGCRVEIW